MSKSKIDAVITDLEMKLETHSSLFGHYVSFRFIDTYPSFPKVQDLLQQVKIREDVCLVNYNYTYQSINEKTDLSYLEFTKH